MYIGIISLSTLENTIYVIISEMTKEDALSKLKEYAYKNILRKNIVSMQVVNIESLTTLV